MKHVNNKGFSLIELMIVVAIIGILATVAIPNFQKFQGKAKQSEAKSQLGGFFMAQKAFFAEYNFYPGQFGLAGFVPQGTLSYRIQSFNSGTTAGTNLPPTMDVAACVSSILPAVCTNAAYGGTLPIWFENGATVVAVPIGNILGSATTFTAGASAKFANVIQQDDWSMNELNVLLNTQYGI